MASLAQFEVDTQLNSLFRSDYHNDQKTVVDVLGKEPTEGFLPPVDTTIHDARKLQSAEDDGSADFASKFFRKHGFVLLPHKSNVVDWDSGAFGPGDAMNAGVDRNVESKAKVNEIKTTYLPEVDQILRQQIFPGKNLRIQQPEQLLRRGPNTAHPFFGLTVHNDYGTSVDDYEENTAAFSDEYSAKTWRAAYEADEVAGYSMVNFWRTVHMSEPLQHMPLAILDASSVSHDDLVHSGLKNFTHTGRISNQLHLKFNENHRWYYYPNMTVDEVLVMNLYNNFKDDHSATFRQCFHSAFENPIASKNAEQRQSCEHRVGVFVLKD